MKIVIIGGGFGGINLAMGLAGHKDYEVTLVDRNNYNFFPPLLYQVATAFLEPSNISYPFRKLFHKKDNLHFRLGELQEVMPDQYKIRLADGEITYDYLVFATGAETNYLGMENIRRNAIPMKTLNDAIQMRNFLLERIEEASIAVDGLEKQKMLTIIIAGGGPTGVEISGMFAEMSKSIVKNEYPELTDIKPQLILIDGGNALLKPMSVKSQNYAYKKLSEMGVTIKLGIHIKDFIDDKVYLDNGEVLEAKSLIWAAGVSATKFNGMPARAYSKGNRLIVDEFNKVMDTKGIYAIGDTCIQTTDSKFLKGHPQMAPVATQQGSNLAKNFKRMASGKALKPFAYFDKGSMAIIGKSKAVVDLPFLHLHFSGLIAWLAWLFVHLTTLGNHRNRVKTLYNWVIALFSGDQSLRMIIRPDTYDAKNKNQVTV